MHVEWDPEDGSDKQVWQFDSGDVTWKEAEGIEQHYDGSYDQWLQGLMIGQVRARSVMLWHMLRQVHPALKYADIPDFRVRQLTTQMGVAELKDLWERVKRVKLKPDQREAFNAQFDTDLADALEREGRPRDGFLINDRGDLHIVGGHVLEPPKREPQEAS